MNYFFKFTTTSAAPRIKISLSNLPQDYDIKLYKSNGVVVALSQKGGTENETITYNTGNVNGGTYYVRVYGYNGAYTSGNCYTLKVETSANSFKEEVMEESSKSEINFYPNPASEVFAAEISISLFNFPLICIFKFEFTTKLCALPKPIPRLIFPFIFNPSLA